MRTNKNKSKIIIAITVAFLATMVSYSGFKNMHNQLEEQQKLIDLMQKTQATKQEDNQGDYAYAVSTTNLKAGEIVADSDVDFKQFDTINTSAFDNRSDVVNKVLLKDINSGEVYTNAHIAKVSNDDVTLKDGYRALTLPADNFQGRSDSMKIGSCVDIYSASSDNRWFLENIKIMSFDSTTGNAANQSNSITNAAAITFEVPASNISDFISNVSKSKLVLVARNPNDKKPSYKKYNSSSSSNINTMSSLPNLPKSVPIKNLDSNLSGLPQPIQPIAQQSSVELIEANVKSKVTFD